MTQSRCPYFGSCGGCSAQHIPYSTQVQNKTKILQRIVKDVEVSVHAGEEYNYRNRMDFVFHPKGLGFREKGKWFKIVDIKECAIAEEQVNKLQKEVRDFFEEKQIDSFNLKKKQGTLRYAVIRTTSKSTAISFVLNKDSSKNSQAISIIEEFSKVTSADIIAVTYVPANTDTSISEESFCVKGEPLLQESYMGFTFEYSIQGFFQNNHDMAENMHKHVNSLLQKYANTKDGTLLDLYGGVGTFGIINASLFNQVLTIESFQGCIDAAKKNIALNNINNAQAIALDAKSIKKQELNSPLYVITDPPRSGMHPKAIDHLNAIKPKVIIYISCNLKQLERELPRFDNYKVNSAALFDLFPQTPHCEGIVELVPK